MALIKGRYETKEKIGKGGMGIVFRTSDREMPQSDVALKTIRELADPRQVELFLRECGVLRELKHPNVIDLYDFGITKENGEEKPFYVMPLLPGVTLDKLIHNNSVRLTPERVVNIITQAAKGLQAAHDLKLIHRDVKPSNIFVLPDDSVKLIDFGVVHLVDQRSRSGLMGTIPYMSPEQLQMLALTNQSDIFSLAVVCYEALTRRRPFVGDSEDEVREAILHTIPPPVSDLNPAVSLALSQVVHASMAKQPWNRTASASQFADELQKASHGQPIDRFDPSRIEPRILRAQKALEASQYEFATDILTELEAEGHIHPSIRSLRRQIDLAVRARTIKQSLESAQLRFAEGEYQLALQKVDEVLRLDPSNEEALSLKREIDVKYRDQQIENWFGLAKDHIGNYAFKPAREALQNVLRLKPTDTRALQMVKDVERREVEYQRQHQEKEQVFSAAKNDYNRGEVTGALNKLEKVLELDRRAPDNSSAKAGTSYQGFYNQVRSEHDKIKNAYEESRKLLSQNDFAGASEICKVYVQKYPNHTLFQALQFDISEQQRQHVSAYIVKVDREVEAELDFDRKVAILSEAQDHYPQETHFQNRLEKVTQRRDHIAQITQRIRNLEDRGEYADALGQLEILGMIYPQYPGLTLEIDRLTKRRDRQSRADEKTQWVQQVDQSVNKGDYTHALTVLKSALVDFPEDAELIALERQARDGEIRSREAIRVFENAQTLIAQGDLKSGIEALWQAHRQDEHNTLILAVLVETLLKRASFEMDRDPTLSEQLIRQASELDPGNSQATSLQQMALDRRKDSEIDQILSGSRELQASGDIAGALASIEKGLSSFSSEPRLAARRDVLRKLLGNGGRSNVRERDLAELRDLQVRMKDEEGNDALNSIMEMSRAIAGKYPGDPNFEFTLKESEDFWDATTKDFRAPSETVSDTSSSSQQQIAPPAEDSQKREPFRKQFESFLSKATVLSSSLRHRAASSMEVLRSVSPKRRAIFGGLAVGIILLAIIVTKVRHLPTPQPPTPPFEAAVTLTASTPGAHLLVNGQDNGVTPQTLKLKEGSYNIDAALDGYESSGVFPLTIARSEKAPAPINISMTVLAPVIRILTDFKDVQVDGERQKPEGTVFTSTALNDGPHKIRLVSPLGDITFIEFALQAGQFPNGIKITGSQIPVTAIATLNASGQLYSNSTLLKASLNGSMDQDVAESGLPLIGLKSGTNDLLLRDGKGDRAEIIEAIRNPALTILVGAPSGGNLLVEEAQKLDGSVSVESKDKKTTATLPLKNGTANFVRLEPKEYSVTISAAGHDTETKTVSITKGNVVKVPVTLNRTITTASLELRGGPPDAELYIDGVRTLPNLSSTGDFTSNQIQPGKHSIELRKPDFESRTVYSGEFTKGAKVPLSRSNLTLTAFGTLTFDVTPPNSDISYSASGEGSHKVKPGDTVSVKQGQYAVSITASNYVTRNNEPYMVAPGVKTTVKIELEAIPPPSPPKVTTIVEPPPQAPKSKGAEILTNMKAGDKSMQCLMNYCFSREKAAGTYSFKIKLTGGLLTVNKQARWVVNYIDIKNFTEYEITEKEIKCSVIVNGMRQLPRVLVHNLKPSGGFFDLTVSVGIGKQVLIYPAGSTTSLIGSTIADPTAGSFGFEKDVAITDFTFKPY